MLFTLSKLAQFAACQKQAADAAVRKSVDSDGKPKAHCRYAQTQSVTKKTLMSVFTDAKVLNFLMKLFISKHFIALVEIL